MMNTDIENTMLAELSALTNVAADKLGHTITGLAESNHRYLRDTKINLSNAFSLASLTAKERYMIATAVAINKGRHTLTASFAELAAKEGMTTEEYQEIQSCVSLMNINNVFYRFRHFAGKTSYDHMPAGIKMSLMQNPVTGKEFFELLSLVISALNGCERCVSAHEQSLMKLGSTEQRVFDAIKLAAMIQGLCVLSTHGPASGK